MIAAYGCSDDSCSNDTQIAMGLEDIGCTANPYNMRVSTENEFELIRSQEDFDALVNIECAEIDWMMYDLVIGNIGLSNGLADISRDYRMNCSSERLSLNIKITTDATTVAPMISWNALIPKLVESETLFVNVEVN